MSAPRSRFSHSSPRIHFLEWNPEASRTVILLHGNSANAWWWQWVADALPEDLRLLALDQRGHGDSEWVKPPAYKPYDYAADLANFIREEVRDRIAQITDYFLAHGVSDPGTAHQKAIVAIGNLVRHQALVMGFSDTFAVLGVVLVLAAIAVLLTRRVKGAAGGAH